MSTLRFAISMASLLVSTLGICADPSIHPAVATGSVDGTQIIGEQESAVGLYLMPWQEEVAGDTDRPPSKLGEPLQAINADAFRNRVELDADIAAYRRSSLDRN